MSDVVGSTEDRFFNNEAQIEVSHDKADHIDNAVSEHGSKTVRNREFRSHFEIKEPVLTVF